MNVNTISRLVCYLLIAGLGALISQGTGVREKLAEMNWMDWTLFCAGIIMLWPLRGGHSWINQSQNMLKNLLAMAALLLAVGCANIELNAYRVTGTTARLVDASMNGWGDWVRAGKATPGDEAKVRAAYEKYQAAIRAERLAVIAYKQSPTNSTALDIAVTTLSVAAGEVVALTTQFGNK